MSETGIYNQFIGRCKWGMGNAHPHTGEILNLQLLFYILKLKILIIVNHCYLMGAFFSTHRDDDVTNWPT